MEQIAKLLFAATLLTIFALVLIFTSTAHIGNGGEYWGYDGQQEASDAAAQAFADSDYRYLEVGLTDSNGMRRLRVPVYSRCLDHPLGREFVTRRSTSEPIHGYDSMKLAGEFALQYNNGMNSLLERHLGACCGDCVQR